MVSELSARTQRNFHCLKVIGADDITLDARRLFGVLKWFFLDVKTVSVDVSSQGQITHDRCGFYSRQTGNPIEDLIIESADSGVVLVSRSVRRDLHRKKITRFKARFDVEHVHKTSDKQSGANQQNQG